VLDVIGSQTTRATLQQLLSRLSRFEPRRVAGPFAETIDWQGAGDERVLSTGPRTSRDEVTTYFVAVARVPVPMCESPSRRRTGVRPVAR
jgi:hypothetical protein